TCALEAIAIDQCDVGPDICVFSNIPLVIVAYLDFKVLRLDMIEKPSGLLIIGVDDGHHFEQFVEGNRCGRGFHVSWNHRSAPLRDTVPRIAPPIGALEPSLTKVWECKRPLWVRS